MMKPQEINRLTQRLAEFLDAELLEEAAAEVCGLHPSDAAEAAAGLEPEAMAELFMVMDPEYASLVMIELRESARDALVEEIPLARLSAIIDEMDSDDAADIVADLDKDDARAVLANIDDEDSAEVERLLRYDPETAGGIMQLELVRGFKTDTVDQAIESIRAKKDEVQDIQFVFVTDRQGRLTGQVSLPALVLAKKSDRLGDIATPVELVIDQLEDQEHVALKFSKYNAIAAPVVDASGRLLGRITVDDVMEVFQEEASEDFFRLAGSHEDEELYSGQVFRTTRLRLPWLFVNLMGGLVSGYLIYLFKVTIKDVLILLTFIPPIMSLGGSVGMQSSTIVVRSMALGRITRAQIVPMLLQEVRVALLLGICCGALAGLIAVLWQAHPMLGVVVGISILTAITIAALMGTLLPTIFRALKVDPALASGPFVTMLNDIVGISVYMGVATAFIKML